MTENYFGHLVLSGSVLSWCFSIPLGILLVIFFFFLNLSPWFTRKRQHFVQSSVPPHCFFTTSKSHKALSNHSLNNYGFQFRMSFSVICTHAHLKITIPTSCYVLLSLVMLRYSHKLTTITIAMWMYFKRCVASNDLAWKGNLIFQNRDTTWQNHHTASWNKPL